MARAGGARELRRGLSTVASPEDPALPAMPTPAASPAPPASRADCAALDAADPLAGFRERFALPEGLIYLDGNSLGPLPHAARERLRAVAEEEWGRGLIRSWNAAGWIEAPARLGARIAPLIGAGADEVVVADSTSVNLYKLLVGALALRPGRRTILTETGNFPTDRYIAQGAVASLGGGHRIRSVAGEELAGALDEDTALLLLTQVDYRTGRLHDMAALTRAAHAAGALALWDLAHSAGALPVALEDCGVDLAVGCTYKYLNGGPGAPAFLYVARRWQDRIQSPLSGWMGHAEPFAFAPDYAPAPGIRRQLCGTPPILALAALEAALEIWAEVDLHALRRKSLALSEAFIALVESRCAGQGLALLTPREAAWRGSQVAWSQPEGYAIIQALIARGVIGDFRAPDVLRFGFAPLYLRFVDVWDAVEALREVLATRAWDRPEHKARAAVT